MSVILIDHQVVHYEVLGRGRPLIFLHGWVGSWRYWIPAMQAASVAYRAYALDFWGYGETAKYQPNYTLNRQVDLIDIFLNEMGIGRVALAGHGLGAVVAILYALRHPIIVDRVMAVGYPLAESCVNPRLQASTPAELAEWLLGHAPLTEPVLADAPKTDLQAITASLVGLSAAEAQDTLARLATACLLVSGLNDQAVAPPDSAQVAMLPASAHAIAFDQSGHFPMLDESSKFNRLLIDFLSLPSGDSPRELQLKEEWKRRVR
ncbi:MAG TPA: alpha/beta hydrolase [Anaerolineaceae bacterium]